MREPPGPRLLPPVGYQGGKRILAPAILDVIRPDPHAPFWDLCTGSGAVALETVRRGHDPSLLTLVDCGPWGEVWRDVGAGCFRLTHLRHLLDEVPDPSADPARVVAHMKWLVQQSVSAQDRPVVFLVLQAAAWGGRAIGWDGVVGWRHAGFHSGWQPPKGSPRQSRNRPFSPSPLVLYERMAAICDALVGIHGIHADVRSVRPDAGVVYLDPPYAKTAGYPSGTFDPVAYATALSVPCWVSERRPLAPHATQLPLRHAGGVRGGHRASREEWLSLVSGAA